MIMSLFHKSWSENFYSVKEEGFKRIIDNENIIQKFFFRLKILSGSKDLIISVSLVEIKCLLENSGFNFLNEVY